MNTRRFASTLFVVVAAVVAISDRPSAYNPYGWKWGTLPVPYYINPANGDVLESTAIAAIQAGADAWMLQADTPFSFHFAGLTNGTTLANNGRNEVFFRDASSGGTIAATYFWYSGGRALDADIVFWDGAYTFFAGTSGCNTGLYIEDVATHEFGHALGLNHSSVAEATMVSGTSYCSTFKRSLDADDIQGLGALYPGGSTAPVANPPTVRILTPTSGSSFPVGTVVTLSGSASDPEDGDLSSTIVWRSNLQGLLGTGHSNLAVSLTAGTHTITASATDSNGATSQATVTVSITNPPPSSGVTLTGTARKAKGLQKADLKWSGAAWTSVDIVRNGTRRATTSNLGSYTDNIDVKGAGAYNYTVCDSGTTTCSNVVTLTF